MAEQNTIQAGPAPKPENQEPAGQLPKQFEIAILPLQNTTLFPGTVVPLAVGRALDRGGGICFKHGRKTYLLYYRQIFGCDGRRCAAQGPL